MSEVKEEVKCEGQFYVGSDKCNECGQSRVAHFSTVTSPIPGGQWKHHKNCAIWTVTTDGKKNLCDCAQPDSVFKGLIASPIPDQDQELKVNEDIKPKHVTSENSGEDADLESDLMPRVINAPERIYLQLGADDEVGEVDFNACSVADISWCNERIHETDVEYARVGSNPTTQATSSASGTYENLPDHGQASEQNDSASPSWWCCDADFPDHAPSCANAESPVEQGEGVAEKIAEIKERRARYEDLGYRSDLMSQFKADIDTLLSIVASALNERDQLREQVAKFSTLADTRHDQLFEAKRQRDNVAAELDRERECVAIAEEAINKWKREAKSLRHTCDGLREEVEYWKRTHDETVTSFLADIKRLRDEEQETKQ